MFFANDTRDKLKAEQPNLKFGRSTSPPQTRHVANSLLPGEVGKVLGERWKALSEAQRAPFDKKAAADKKRYEDEKAAYQAVSLKSSFTRMQASD